jgi:prepilin-type processing-associated H-X9-DG protein
MNSMRQIGLAMHNYHDAHDTFPPAYIADEDGQPMHSWRVLILPNLGQEYIHVYEQYRFDEPWDSPHNQTVTNVPIAAYCCPSDPATSPGSTHTNYHVLTGPGTVFEDAKAMSVRDIRDGTSNTLMVVESTGPGRHWAEPVDLDASKVVFPLDSGSPDSPGSFHPGGMHALFFDGSVQFLAHAISPQLFQALTTRNGGEVTNSAKGAYETRSRRVPRPP